MSYYRRSYGNRSGTAMYNKRPQQPRKNHSGCQMKKDYRSKSGEEKAIVIYGWKYTRKFGLMSFVASPAKHQTGSKWCNMVVNITSSMGKSTMFAQWNPDKNILWMPDVKMIASPSKGYWSYLKPKNFK